MKNAILRFMPEQNFSSPDILFTPSDSVVRDLADPDGTLPEVALSVFARETVPTESYQERAYILHEDKPVGWCTLATHLDKGTVHFRDFALDSPAQRASAPEKNFRATLRLAAYILAIETAHTRALPFVSQKDARRSAGASVWESLVACGVATVQRPDTSNPTKSNYMAGVLRPSPDQLQALRTTILSHEPPDDPFDGIPAGVDLRNFAFLTAPASRTAHDAPAQILKAPDGRVVWLSTFRNPDTNAILKQSILVLDPPANHKQRPPAPDESYTLLGGESDELSIQRHKGPAMTAQEVKSLQNFINASFPMDPFGS